MKRRGALRLLNLVGIRSLIKEEEKERREGYTFAVIESNSSPLVVAHLVVLVDEVKISRGKKGIEREIKAKRRRGRKEEEGRRGGGE